MDRYRVKPDTRLLLSERDPAERHTFDAGKKDGNEYLRELNTQLRDLQELLYAEGKHRILVVLQATDTGGKDGVIRQVFRTVNPQGVKVSKQAARLQDRLDDPAKTLEVQPRGSRRTEALGRLSGSLRGDAEPHEHRMGTLVYRSLQR